MSVICLPGDGIGPEVMAESIRVLELLCPGLRIEVHPLGMGALREHGEALPQTTVEACRRADAVLMGAVGLDDQLASDDNPERAMFTLRKTLDVYANLRPFKTASIDMMIVRELVGGLYFGVRGERSDGVVFDTCEYHPDQARRVLVRGFELARARSGRLASVDKANVLATSRMWRRVADEVAREFPDVALEHLLVDTAALQLVRAPERFDVIVTENTFGDILSDVAAGVADGLGVAASAALGDSGPGLFEPVHGTAPDIAGRGVANPTAMLLSTALMLRHGLGLRAEADALERAVETARSRVLTPDLGGTAGTRELGDCVLRALASGAAARPAPSGAPQRP